MSREYSHIEIVGGLVSSATITDANGTREEPGMVGKHRYFVDVVEKDGGKIPMWDGKTYEEAKKEAESLRQTFEVSKIVDLTGRAA